MVELTATMEENSDGAHGEGLDERKVTQGNKTFKNKGTRSNSERKKTECQTC